MHASVQMCLVPIMFATYMIILNMLSTHLKLPDVTCTMILNKPAVHCTKKHPLGKTSEIVMPGSC